jgi:tRNA(Ile)-lysidine synthase
MSFLMEKILSTIDEMHMLDPGNGVVVGISGGPDSTVLLHVLHQLREERDIWMTAVHVNHGLRGEESIHDAEFARGQAEELGIPFQLVNLSSLGEASGSIQQRARDARYLQLRRIASSCGARRIALGHHADDSIEWALMNLIQGSGLSGLRGIPPVREEVIRPLIRIRKSEILAYLAQRGIPYVEDSSNCSLSYLRNRIRHTLIPFLEEHFNPRVKEALWRILSIAALEDEYLAKEAERWFTQALVGQKDGILRMDRAVVTKTHPAIQARVIRHAIASMAGGTQSLTFHHIQSILQMIKKGGRARRFDLPLGITVGTEYESFLIEKRSEGTDRGFYHVIEEPGSFWLHSLGVRLTFHIQPSAFGIDLKQCPPRRAYLDAERCAFPLTIRNPRPGDRFQPLGMDTLMKLKDFFIHQRIPRSSRAQTPLLISQQKIAWVVGLRIDSRFKVERREVPVLMAEATPVRG